MIVGLFILINLNNDIMTTRKIKLNSSTSEDQSLLTNGKPILLIGQSSIIGVNNKGRKKHLSALGAVSRLRSAVGKAKPNSYSGTNYRHTGTNISYGE